MQTTTTRLHPLLAAAALSLIVLSGVGVAAMTGMIPVTKGQNSALEVTEEMVKPEMVKPVSPAKSKPVSRTTVPAPQPVAEVFPVAETPKPQVPVGQLATVESVREVKEPGDAKGMGAIAGGVVGGVLGNKLGKGRGLATVLGAAGGAFAGHQIEKQVRADKRWEIALRLDDGSLRTLPSAVEPAWRAGDRVRIVDDKLQAI
ncbi:MAG TPA: glycine zipper 2TM domain-containing protein [Burkholderiales bacterium]|nr:glycine zipper 2TM domain-containing protein [Burkholderiales bacterium]